MNPSNWPSNEPLGIGTCLSFYSPKYNSGNFGWADFGCEEKVRFICEVSINTGR